MKDIKVYLEDDGTMRVRVDREGERAVSTQVDPVALINRIADVAGLDVLFNPGPPETPQDEPTDEPPIAPDDAPEPPTEDATPPTGDATA